MLPKQLRRRRRRSDFFEDPQQYLWAISYSDLLMVLMCFFVIYFEISTVKPGTDSEKPFTKILMAIKSETSALNAPESTSHGDESVSVGSATPGTGTGTGKGTGTGTSAGSLTGSVDAPSAPAAPVVATPTVLDRLELALKGSDVVAEANLRQRSLLIHFPENMYGAGEFAVDHNIETRLQEVLAPITQYKDTVVITFIGHTDTAPIKRLDRRIIDSNLVLSNLRASRAAEVALK